MSRVARRSSPRGFDSLLAWFLDGFRAEVPETIHKGGVWRDYVRLDEDRQAVGGSLLGAPALADDFRRLLEGSPFATEPSVYDGNRSRVDDDHYVMPMRAAIAGLAGRGDDDAPMPFMARTLYRVAYFGGDWDAACASMGINPASIRQVYVESALIRLYRRWSVGPPRSLASTS